MLAFIRGDTLVAMRVDQPARSIGDLRAATEVACTGETGGVAGQAQLRFVCKRRSSFGVHSIMQGQS